jgi:hypothetical protein
MLNRLIMAEIVGYLSFRPLPGKLKLRKRLAEDRRVNAFKGTGTHETRQSGTCSSGFMDNNETNSGLSLQCVTTSAC